MARRSKPWFHARDQRWVTIVGGKTEHLATAAEGEQRAWEVFYEVMAKAKEKVVPPPKLTAVALFDHFLDYTQRKQAAATYDTHHRHLNHFVKYIGHTVAAEDLRPFHVTEWLATKQWSDTTQYGAITSVKCALSWGVREGYIETNPIRAMRRPTPARRTTVMDHEQFTRVLGAVDDPAFRDFLMALRETGARPSEIMVLELSMVDQGKQAAVFASKTSRKTGRQRVIYLNRIVMEMIDRLGKIHPHGPLFRNSRGAPWNRSATIQRFIRLRAKLGYGPEVTAESFRHMFATDALESGIPIATVAQLMGHSTTDMINHNYSHLEDRSEHLKDSLQRVRPDITGNA